MLVSFPPPASELELTTALADKLLHAVGSAERLGPVASVYTSLAAMTAAISLGFDSLRESAEPQEAEPRS